MTSIEQKNKNILSRFDSEKTGSKICVFNVKTKCGKNAVMISMDKINLNKAKKDCVNVFGGNFDSIKDRT